MIKFYNLVFMCLALTACATPKAFVPTDGSRADGTVELSYEYDDFEEPVVDPN